MEISGEVLVRTVKQKQYENRRYQEWEGTNGDGEAGMGESEGCGRVNQNYGCMKKLHRNLVL